MKHVFFIFASAWLALSGLAAIPGTVQVSAPVAPSATNSPYGAQVPRYGYGGFLTGASSLSQLQDTNWFPIARRTGHAGMIGVVTNTGAQYILGDDLVSWYNTGSTPSMAQLRLIEPGIGGTVIVDSYYGDGVSGQFPMSLTNTTVGTNAYGGLILARGGTNSWEIQTPNGETTAAQFGIVPTTNHCGDTLTSWTDWNNSRLYRSILTSGEYYINNTNGWRWSDNTHVTFQQGAAIVRNFSDPSGFQNIRYSAIRITNSAIPFGGSVPIYATNITGIGITAYTLNPDTSTNVGNNLAIVGASGVRLRDCNLGQTRDGWALVLGSDNLQVSGTFINNTNSIYRDGIHVIAGTNWMITESTIYAGDDALAVGGSGSVIGKGVIATATVHSDYANAVRFTQETQANTNIYFDIIVSDVVYRSGEFRNGAVLFQNLSTNITLAFTNITLKSIKGDIAYKTAVVGVDRGFSIVDADNILLIDCTVDQTVRNPFYIENSGVVSLVDCVANGTTGTNLLQTIYAIDVGRLNVTGGTFKTNPTNAANTVRLENVLWANFNNVYLENLTGQQVFLTAGGVGNFQMVGSRVLASGSLGAFTVNPTNVLIVGNVISATAPSWQGGSPPAGSQLGPNVGFQSIGDVTGSQFTVISSSGAYVGSIDAPGNVRTRFVNTNAAFVFAQDAAGGVNVLGRIGFQTKNTNNNPIMMLSPQDTGSTPWFGIGGGSGLYNSPRFVDMYTTGTDYTAGSSRFRFQNEGLRIEPSGITSNPTSDSAIQVVSTSKGSRATPPMTTAQRLAISITAGASLQVYDSDFSGVFVLRGSGTNSWRSFTPLVLANQGDASVTLNPWQHNFTAPFSTTLTANRTVTLGTTGAISGDTITVVRTGLGAFTLDVGGLKTIPSATAATVVVQYNGSAWVLIGYQLL